MGGGIVLWGIVARVWGKAGEVGCEMGERECVIDQFWGGGGVIIGS